MGDKDYSSRSGGGGSGSGSGDSAASSHGRVKDSRSMHGTGSSSTPEPKYKLSGSADLSEEELSAEVYEIFSAYVRNNNMEAALRSICGEMNESNIKESLEVLVDKELDSKAARRQHLGTLIQNLVKEDLILISDVKGVISSFYNDAPEYLSDIPRFWEYFVEIFACLFVPSKEFSSFRKAEIVLPLSFAFEFLPNSFESTSSSNKTQQQQQQHGLAFVSALLNSLVGLIGQERTSELFHSSSFFFSASSTSSSSQSSKNNNSISAAVLIEKLISSSGSNSSSSSSSSSGSDKYSFLREPPRQESPEALKRKIESLFGNRSTTNEAILKWVHESVAKDVSESKVFIRTFVMECIRSTIRMPQSELITDDITKRIPLLSKVLGSDSEKQLQALFAIQKLVIELTYPPGLLPNLFSKLSEAEVIKDEVFLKWRDDGSASERDGKGVCVSTLTRFFEAIEN